MLLEEHRSLCERFQKIIVSEENGRQHRVINSDPPCSVRKYHLDGDIIKQRKCCDYLVLDDTKMDAYFIELKGINIDVAIEQLEAAISIVNSEISEIANYRFLLRIVSSRTKTHKLKSSSFRKAEEKYGDRLKYCSVYLEDHL